MAFPLIFVGLILLVTAVRGTHSQLFTVVKSDFTGNGNFLWWILVVLAVGAIGYIKPLRALSWGFLTILILVLLLSKGNPQLPGGGFFQQLLSGINSGT